MSVDGQTDSRINVVHPGYVISRSDGDRHYIGFVTLCKLYGLNPYKTINGDTQRIRLVGQGFRHFYPRDDGNYSRVS